MNLLRSLKDPLSSRQKTTLNFAGNLTSHLFGDNDVEDVIEQSLNDAESVSFSLQDKLNVSLQKDGPPIAVGGQDSFKWMKAKFTLFSNPGQRIENRQILYIAIYPLNGHQRTLKEFLFVCYEFLYKVKIPSLRQ
ncbi:hypothetical protein ACJMK2_030995, partial [Sinanodonta woodiana]